MEIEQKVKLIIAETLSVNISSITDDLAVGDIDQWDSVNNVKILQSLEAEFNIEIDVLDALDAEDVHDFVEIVKRMTE